jgi:hypothetical protein
MLRFMVVVLALAWCEERADVARGALGVEFRVERGIGDAILAGSAIAARKSRLDLAR